MAEENTIDYHLRQAMNHLETAITMSVEGVANKNKSQREIGSLWEHFLGEFFGCVRAKGRQHRVNLLAWIRFPRLR